MTDEHMQRTAWKKAGPFESGCCSWKSSCLCAFVMLVLLMFAGSMQGQGTEGNITGAVTAPDGTLIAKAKVTVTNEATNLSRTVMSDAKGEYFVADLNPGTYTVKIDAPGFSELRDTSVALAAQQTIRIDGNLKVGGASSSVTVTGDASVINLEMPSISSTVTAEALNDSSSNLLGTSDSTGDSGLLFEGPRFLVPRSELVFDLFRLQADRG